MDITETQIEETDDNKFYIIKGRFKSNSLNFYGLLVIVFNERQALDLCQAIISTYSTLFDLEPHQDWVQFREVIVNSKWKGNFNPSMSTAIQEVLDNLPKDNPAKEQLFENLINNDQDAVDLFIFDLVNRVIHDSNLILETNIQELTADEYRESKSEKVQTADTSQVTTSTDGAVTIPIQLILAPVSGKPIYELKVGDKIMTKIIPNTEKALNIIEQLDLKIDDHVKPAPSEVIEIKARSREEPLEILVQLGPGIYGRCTEEERQVKLRLYDPEVDGALKKAPAKKPPVQNQKNTDQANNVEKGIPKVTLLTGGLLILIILLFIIILLYY